MPPELESLALRVATLESDNRQLHSGIAKDLSELLSGLKGSANAPGLYETARKLTESVQSLTSQLAAARSDLDALKEMKQKMSGAYLACGTIGAVVGFLASFLR